MAMMKTCPGYTSDGSGGQAYAQGRHDLENNTVNFGPGKSQCRTCYGVYAKDWRAKRNVGGTTTSRRGSRVAKQTIVIPDLRAPAMDGGDEFVSDEDLAASRSHEFIPQPDLMETWAAMAQDAADGGHPYNLIFLGPSGSGKTEAASFLAATVGLPFTKVDAPSMTDPESWFGTREVVAEDGVSVTSYRPSAFVLAIEEPGVLLIDEANRIRDEHRNILLALLDGTHQCTNPLTGDVVRKHPRCFVIMTGNVGLQFTGTYAIDPALLTRALTINFAYAPHDAEVKIAKEATGCDDETAETFVRFAEESRDRAKLNPDFSPISTREVMAACRLVAKGLNPDIAASVVVMNSASDEGGAASVRTGLEQVWTGIRREKANAAAGTRDCGMEAPSWLGSVKCLEKVALTTPAGEAGHTNEHHGLDLNGSEVRWAVA